MLSQPQPIPRPLLLKSEHPQPLLLFPHKINKRIIQIQLLFPKELHPQGLHPQSLSEKVVAHPQDEFDPHPQELAVKSLIKASK